MFTFYKFTFHIRNTMFPLLKTCLHYISLLFIFHGGKSNELKSNELKSNELKSNELSNEVIEMIMIYI